MRMLLTALLLTTLVPRVPFAASRHADLETWLTGELVPYVTAELTASPRFRNQSVRFVLMSGDTPRTEGTALAFAIRDRLRDAAGDIPGIRVTWLADRPGAGLASAGGYLDCTKNESDYLVGVDLEESSPGVVEIRVGALDVAEREWVAGFGKSWQGPVTGPMRQALNHYVSDPTFRGERDAPWEDTETDLMAAQLAYELGCKLLGQTRGEYVVAANDIGGDVDATTALVELVGNNLAGVRALQFAAGDTNAVIEGKAHRIDDDLFQYWVTITPTDPASEMRTLSADAYIRIPDPYRAATLIPDEVYELAASDSGFLKSFRLIRMADESACVAARPLATGISGRRVAGDCFALQLATGDDAVTFFLTHQLNHGLVRLADRSCGDRAMARIARANEKLRVALPPDTLRGGEWSDKSAWSLDPRTDTWYVLAASDSRAGRALARHVENLPVRCSASVRPGLEGEALRRWLEELDAIIEHWAPAIDWRSIQVKDVY